jgi:hypothetical protein
MTLVDMSFLLSTGRYYNSLVSEKHTTKVSQVLNMLVYKFRFKVVGQTLSFNYVFLFIFNIFLLLSFAITLIINVRNSRYS